MIGGADVADVLCGAFLLALVFIEIIGLFSALGR